MPPISSPDGSQSRARPANSSVDGPAASPGGPPRPRSEAEPSDPSVAEQATRDLAAQFEDEKPGRVLSGPAGLLLTVAALAVGALALWQVFRPLSQGSKYYLIIFLAGVLPLVFLAYPSDLRLPARLRARRPRADRAEATGSDSDGRVPAPASTRPTVTDWALSALAVAACLYPVLPARDRPGGGGGNAVGA
ncbi:hypothetical protein AB0B48_28110, partial [Micromonospora sp. NPDC049089]